MEMVTKHYKKWHCSFLSYLIIVTIFFKFCIVCWLRDFNWCWNRFIRQSNRGIWWIFTSLRFFLRWHRFSLTNHHPLSLMLKKIRWILINETTGNQENLKIKRIYLYYICGHTNTAIWLSTTTESIASHTYTRTHSYDLSFKRSWIIPICI